MTKRRVVKFHVISDNDLIERLSLCCQIFKPLYVIHVIGVDFRIAIDGINIIDLHIHVNSSTDNEFYAFLQTQKQYDTLRNNVMKEKLKL